MEIRILRLLEGAKQAEGLTVIIDVFRAFSLEAYLYDMGAARIFPVGSIEKARELKAQHPEYLLVGERNGKKCEGFDFGNSPSSVNRKIVAGKSIVHTTSAGTQGIANARNAQEVITGSLVNAKAIARYIREKNPEIVSLVCMGNSAVRIAMEDELCAEYIKSLLEGTELDISARAAHLRYEGGEHFFNPDTQEVYPEPDFWLCSKYDLFDFVIRVTPEEDYFVTEKIEV